MFTVSRIYMRHMARVLTSTLFARQAQGASFMTYYLVITFLGMGISNVYLVLIGFGIVSRNLKPPWPRPVLIAIDVAYN